MDNNNKLWIKNQAIFIENWFPRLKTPELEKPNPPTVWNDDLNVGSAPSNTPSNTTNNGSDHDDNNGDEPPRYPPNPDLPFHIPETSDNDDSSYHPSSSHHDSEYTSSDTGNDWLNLPLDYTDSD
ncbi:hypothetical protein VKT23_006081 [Stygiomarasmius scandens]|uniref:Uncharacterized protein n=1 Tax=Marasmiellus scandens TaxID=2682957 RepID=A0ABR1JP48_9AGAR